MLTTASKVSAANGSCCAIDLQYSDHLEQHWTLPHVPGPRYADKPVYILTSGRTISAGEAFA
jgi:hypothetical protein